MKIKNLKLRKELREGEMIPKYYGIAYGELDRLIAVAYPIPLNIIVALWQKVYLLFRWGRGKNPIDAIQSKWWHKLLFWKKWNYAIDHWRIKREFKLYLQKKR